MWKRFKKFIANGNILNLAIGVIMGTSFTAIVNSLVDDVFMPLIVAHTGQADVSGLVIRIGSTQIAIGHFLQAVINFILIAGFLFVIVEVVNRLQTPEVSEEDSETSEIELLQAILDELQSKKTS